MATHPSTSRGLAALAATSALGLAALANLGATATGQDAPKLPPAAEHLRSVPYRSPYAIAFAEPAETLVADIVETDRGELDRESAVDAADWYANGTRKRWGAWGPPARLYPEWAGLEAWPVARKRERAIAEAMRFVGYTYQHHHVPDWDPPADWPWKEVKIGRNGKGVDCSNFTSFVFNQGFGLKLDSEIGRQSALGAASIGPGPRPGRRWPIERVELPAGYRERQDVLRTGDLVFIRSDKGNVSHVVLWVGPIGRSPDGAPLIIDSHGDGVKDANGASIPDGVQLRPFLERSWYNRAASHALRVFRDTEPGPDPGPATATATGSRE